MSDRCISRDVGWAGNGGVKGGMCTHFVSAGPLDRRLAVQWTDTADRSGSFCFTSLGLST